MIEHGKTVINFLIKTAIMFQRPGNKISLVLNKRCGAIEC